MSASECAACGEHFTSVTPFDLHQRLADGKVICLPPAYIRNQKGDLVLAVIRRTRDGRPVWGKAGSDSRFSTSHQESQTLSAPSAGDWTEAAA